MGSTELDDRIGAMARPATDGAAREAVQLALATRATRPSREGRPRGRWVTPVLLSGALALTAGAGTATLAMSHWGGVSMPLENVRNSQPIPVNWMTESGHIEACRAWIELRNPQPQDRAALDAAIVRNDWSSLGQRLYDDAEAVPDDLDGEARVGEALTPVLWDFVVATFPGVLWLGDGVDSDARAVDALGMTCVPEAE